MSLLFEAKFAGPELNGCGECFPHATQVHPMRIRRLSRGTMCPLGGWLWDGSSPLLAAATIVCHCLLIETEVGLVLVDTGFGLRDIAQPRRLSRVFTSRIGSG